MASLKDIRRRIGSVKNTQQITKAMKMVAAAKLRRAQEMITNARPYAEKIDELSTRLMTELARKTESMRPEDTQKFLLSLHPLLKKSENEKPSIAMIVVSSDRGLCGAYNANISKYALKHYNRLVEENTDSKVDLFFVGNKARGAFANKGFQGEVVEGFWQGSFTRAKCNELADRFMGDFISGTYDRVEIAYTEFKSALTQVQTHRSLLPLAVNIEEGAEEESSSQEADGEAQSALPFMYKPSQKELLEKLLPAQVQTQFFRAFADSLASEFGSRMTSMDNATRNASEMIGALTLQANRLRQAAITTELTEIVSGAEALKG